MLNAANITPIMSVVSPTMAEFVAQYQKKLEQFFVRRSHNRWDAEELTQEVFCKILKRQERTLCDYTDAYVYTIAWSVLRDRARREKVRRRNFHVVYDEKFEQEDAVGPEHVLSGSELYQRYLDVLNKLPQRCRDVFVLSRHENLSYAQIAAHFGVSLSAVEKQMIVALSRLRTIL